MYVYSMCIYTYEVDSQMETNIESIVNIFHHIFHHIPTTVKALPTHHIICEFHKFARVSRSLPLPPKLFFMLKSCQLKVKKWILMDFPLTFIDIHMRKPQLQSKYIYIFQMVYIPITHDFLYLPGRTNGRM